MSFKKEQINFINQSILSKVKALKYSVKDSAPSSTQDLFNSTSLVVWSGASDKTVYQDAAVNHAFRAWHDALHIETQLPFTIQGELELGRIQASQCDSQFLADLVYCEVAGQVLHFEKTGQFVSNQVEFTVEYMRKLGYLK